MMNQELRTVTHGQCVDGRAVITDGTSTEVIAAQGAGMKICITSVIVSNSSSTAVEVDIRDGQAGTVRATFPAPANKAGVVLALPDPIILSANTGAYADPDAAVTSVKVTLVGHLIAS